MKCPKCDREVPDGARFCAYCRQPLEENSLSGRITEEKLPGLGEMKTVVSSAGEEERKEITARYQVIEVLGKGGMGKVYKCLDSALQREVAVKILRSDMEAGSRGIERFLAGGKAIAGLNHQNIVQIHDIGEDPQGHYLIMELIEGRTLDELIRERGAFYIDEILEIAIQAGKGLAYAHRLGIIHRNIKPANIMLTEDGAVKITGFGLAQIGTKSELSTTDYGLKTLDYMPPEQRENADFSDPRVDVFAFGATLYELATGKSPKTIRESEIPLGLRETILRALEEKIDNRFPSLEAMLEELGRPTVARKAEKLKEKEIISGACPACGHRNTLEARFCEECGAGLFERCPKCAHDVRVGVRYCPSCRFKIAGFKKYKGHLSATLKYRKNYQYGKAIREYTAAVLCNPRLVVNTLSFLFIILFGRALPLMTGFASSRGMWLINVTITSVIGDVLIPVYAIRRLLPKFTWKQMIALVLGWIVSPSIVGVFVTPLSTSYLSIFQTGLIIAVIQGALYGLVAALVFGWIKASFNPGQIILMTMGWAVANTTSVVFGNPMGGMEGMIIGLIVSTIIIASLLLWQIEAAILE